MNYRKQLIDYIERCYQSYSDRQSDVLFNAATNDIFDLVFSIPICKNIVTHVKKLHPIDNDLLERNQMKDYYDYIGDITLNNDYYVSYCLHWFDYIKSKGIHSPQGYDQECNWLNSCIRGSNDTMMLFKTDFVRTIL